MPNPLRIAPPAAALTLFAAILVGCGRGGDEPGKPIPVVQGKRCVVSLHGKSGTGGPSTEKDGITRLRPTGNADGWGGRQWLYFPEGEYEVVRGTLASTLAASGCDQVVVQGFSNGAAAAAKLYCRGETFGGHVVGYVIDDPVVDHAVEACKPAPGVKVRLYWTGALSNAVEGWSCKEADWTCEGGSTIGVQRYAAALGVAITPSPHQKHEEYLDPPEYSSWLPTR